MMSIQDWPSLNITPLLVYVHLVPTTNLPIANFEHMYTILLTKSLKRKFFKQKNQINLKFLQIPLLVFYERTVSCRYIKPNKNINLF